MIFTYPPGHVLAMSKKIDIILLIRGMDNLAPGPLLRDLQTTFKSSGST